LPVARGRVYLNLGYRECLGASLFWEQVKGLEKNSKKEVRTETLSNLCKGDVKKQISGVVQMLETVNLVWLAALVSR
jgi:hypothetical protein